MQVKTLRNKGSAIKTFIICILICQGAGFIGSFFTAPAIPEWYEKLVRPSFAPPNWIFAPVWTTLFIMMGISLFLVWQTSREFDTKRPAVISFGIQLLLNMLWSVLFFGLRSPSAAFVEIIFLWISIAITIALFFKLSRIAAILLLPYILWVSFAAFLNFSFWNLN